MQLTRIFFVGSRDREKESESEIKVSLFAFIPVAEY